MKKKCCKNGSFPFSTLFSKRTKDSSSSRGTNTKNNSFLSNVILPEKHVNVVAIPKIQENPVFNGSQAELQNQRGGSNNSIYTATVKSKTGSVVVKARVSLALKWMAQ